MALYKKKQKLWIWKALCRDTGELIAWACGDRDKATLKKLIQIVQTLEYYRKSTKTTQDKKVLVEMLFFAIR